MCALIVLIILFTKINFYKSKYQITNPSYITSLDKSEASPDIDGKSLIKIGNSKYDKERCILSEYHGAGAYGGAFMLRMGDYKYIYYVGHERELFDVREDPNEEVNLCDQVKYNELVDKLDKELNSINKPL